MADGNATPDRAAKRFLVLPQSRSHHGTSWGPFTLDEARTFVHNRDGDGFIVLPEDEYHENPRIWNYVDPDSSDA